MNTARDEHVYYIRTCKGCPPIATVAVGREWGTGIWSRGVALCSYDETFNRREGRHLALARLDRAIGSKRDEFPIGLIRTTRNGVIIRPIGVDVQELWRRKFHADIEFKSEYNVDPTEFELYIFDRYAVNQLGDVDG